MKNSIKLITFLLAFALIGCQNGSEESTPQQSAQQGMQQGQQSPQGMQQFQQGQSDVDLSDEELDEFLAAVTEAQKIQMESQQEMIGIIKDEGLDVKTYNQIAQAQQSGQSPEEAGVSEEEMQKFNDVSSSIQEAQKEIEAEMSTAIEESGMEMSRFQEINQAIQQDPQLQQRIQQKMQQQMQQQAPQGQQAPPSGN